MRRIFQRIIFFIKDTILSNSNTLLEESKKEAEKNDTLVIFQRKLKNVPHWTSAYVDNEVEKIKKNCPWFLELLTAVIITNVKILTSVKVSKTKKKIQIKTLEGLNSCYESESQNQLKQVQQTALNNENLFEALMEACKVCSLGQITNALFDVGGQYRRNM